MELKSVLHCKRSVKYMLSFQNITLSQHLMAVLMCNNAEITHNLQKYYFFFNFCFLPFYLLITSFLSKMSFLCIFMQDVYVYFISDCGEHHALAHASITYDTNFTTVNNTANVQCHSGYFPDGVQVIKCQENGTWSSSQSCTVKGQCNI